MSETAHAAFARLRGQLDQAIVGQPELIDALLIALLADRQPAQVSPRRHPSPWKKETQAFA